MSNALPNGNGPIELPSGQIAAAEPPPLEQRQQGEQLPVIAEPLHLQRLEAAMDMRPFMAYARQALKQPLSSGGDDSADDFETPTMGESFEDVMSGKKKPIKRTLGTKEERQSVKTQIYNFNDITSDRQWLYEVLLSDTESEPDISDEDDYIKELLKTHLREQKHRENFYKKATNTQFAYYGAGMLSNHDMFPEHQQSIVGVRKRKRRTQKEKPPKVPKLPKTRGRKPHYAKQQFDQPEPGEIHPDDLKHFAFGDTVVMDGDDDDDDDDSDELDSTLGGPESSSAATSLPGYSGSCSTRGRRRKSQQARTPAVMAARRRRVWQMMAKKELGRCHRARQNNHKEMLQNCKRVATMCMKVVRQRAMLSQKVMKETVWRAKRLTREMLGYWKRYERVERDTRRRMEKEAEEQRKMDVEIIEAKRQQRKLNFLITQTELYAHFMSKKLGQGSEEDQLRILNQLDEELNPRLAAYDDYDAEHMKQLAQQNAELAFSADSAKTKQFSGSAKIKKETVLEGEEKLVVAVEQAIKQEVKEDLPQPDMFKGTLKGYQIKGMTWLANLYDQGISGILADEMGLGKTVQSIAFLCHIAERYGVWGPFLVISPASTLHNWQQEMQRFVPDFNVVPYWGSPNERKILRQFWEQKDLHTRDASFHVVITSYQLIVSDYKYFNRIKWQYMVLDEAQAIKSASSMRWKLLLGFNCRNRLLLSGTPIQNSMAELWALLHFIMPTLFDSHDEFNEWFSKDIESHAENKTGIDEKQISRLHMILKPFMLRRIKKDVENELSDKIEIMVYCPLTIRQRLLYMALKQKIRIEDLLHLTGGGAGSSSTNDGHNADRNFTSNLMNLVMQFRKVCNHPELFERRDVKSSFAMRCEEYVVPRLVYNECLFYRGIPSKRHLLYNKFSIFKAEHIQRSLFRERKRKQEPRRRNEHYSRYIDLNTNGDSAFSFTRFCDLSNKDLEDVSIGGLISFWLHYRYAIRHAKLLAYRRQWWAHYRPTRFRLLEPMLEQPLLQEHSVLHQFIFTAMTANESSVYAFGDYTTANMQETIEHRVIRSRLGRQITGKQQAQALLDEFDAAKELKMEMDVDVEGDDSRMSMPTPPLSKKSSCTEASKTPTKASAATLILLPEFVHVPRKARQYYCEALEMPRFLYGLNQRVQATKRRLYCESRAAEWAHIRHTQCENPAGLELTSSGLALCHPRYGWSSITIPDKQTLVSDAGKLSVLDSLLTRLKAQGHRVLIYSQMTKMIDLLEEYMWHRKHRYMRLDGSSKISARRDMVADFQTRADIFVFLLSTRAGGLGINLTAADTVIFYDSDWNPTVDQQAMDRAHRLGQTKQVTVYRLICKGTIEERILQRAREKSEIQRMVISGGNFKPDTLKPKEVVSLLLDDEEIKQKYRQKAEPDAGNGNSHASPAVKEPTGDKKRRALKHATGSPNLTVEDGSAGSLQADSSPGAKRVKFEAATDDDSIDVSTNNATTNSSSPALLTAVDSPLVPGATTVLRQHDDSDNEALIVDCESAGATTLHGVDSPTLFSDYGRVGRIRRRHHPRGTRRGRPRGSTSRGRGGGLTRASTAGMPPTAAGVAEGNTAAVAFNATLAAAPSGPPTMVVKRGPGRPRLKTAGGPAHHGSRGSSSTRARKHTGPLAVPLGHSPAATPLTRSPAMSPAHSEQQRASSQQLSAHTQRGNAAAAQEP